MQLGEMNPRVSEKRKALIAYHDAYHSDHTAPGWRARLDHIEARLNRLGVSMRERNAALWRDPRLKLRRIYPLTRGRRANPILPEKGLSPPEKAALWIGSIATIIGGSALLIGYLWPLPTERLDYKGIVYDVNRSGGSWTSSFAYQNQSFAINGTSRDDIIAKTHNQIDNLVAGT